MQLRNLQLRKKLTLIITLASVMALLVAGLAFASYDLFSLRASLLDVQVSHADILAANCTAAVSFKDQAAATEILASLRGQRDTVAAALYTPDGDLFCKYLRKGASASAVPARLKKGRLLFDDGSINVYKDVELKGEHLGTLYIRSDMQGWYRRLKSYASIVGVLLLGAVVFAYVLSTRLQRVISVPILKLHAAMRTVSAEKNYSLRVAKSSGDEIGDLGDSFNAMLSEIEERDAALRNANDELEVHVKHRTEDLEAANHALEEENAERKRMEVALRESEARSRATFEQAAVGISHILPDGRWLVANQKLCDIVGYTHDELLDRRIHDITHSSDLKSELDLIHLLLDGEINNYQMEKRYIHKNGSVVWTDLTVSLVRKSCGEPDYFITVIEDITIRKEAEAALSQRAELAALAADIGLALVGTEALQPTLQSCTEAVVKHLGAAFARIWTLDATGKVLELQASSGMYTHLDGPHARVPVGKFKIGLIAEEREPHLTNDVMNDPRVSNREWAQREGMVAFVGHPLIVGERLVGVLAMFAREPQTSVALDSLEAIARTIAIGIDRKWSEDLQIEKEAAEQANRAKSEFLSRMSHELRTPLNAILGFGQLLEMQELDPGNLESVEQILRGGRHLLTLINEVLDISMIDSGNLAVSLEPVCVSELVEETLGLVRPLASQRNVALYPGPSDEAGLHVAADRQRLKQVLLNVLSNAIKYNREGGSVLITYACALDGRVVICVRDTGVGIAPGLLSRLFTPFDRLNAAQGGVEGTGLGLALSKRLIEVMHGRVWAESEFGIGSTFHIELPFAESPASFDNAAPEAQQSDEPAPERPVVLYIEDNLPNLRLIEAALGSKVHLVSVMQGTVGLDLFRENRPNLVLLDLNLPDISGQEVLARLRRDPDNEDVPVVIISADATPSQIDRLLSAGANHYLTKPIDVKELLSVVDQLLAAA